MKIQDLFERDIYRHINGVIKADQLDASSVWQELDEFVITAELNRHLHRLVSVLLSTIDSPPTASSRNGIWVSGFFGSGKSHFIKVLSYLLQNDEHVHNGERRRAVDFFNDKIEDPLLLADLKRVVATAIDTILFNVDVKADTRAGRDALLRVFLKVLNEKQNYSGDHPHIAHMERYLDEKGQLDQFHAAFERASGESWLQERDAWEFHRDEVIAALTETLGQSEGSVEKWVDGAEDNFSLTVENFARWVKRYLDSQGPDHRIMFLADEVGQFIGSDTHLMLSLQTITEQLGTVCHGRAWVVVTSQEDLDAVLDDLKNTKAHDFSKIQGRFNTRLSLSSANVDEVIKKRLLAKKPADAAPLHTAYDGKHDILRNQLSFVRAGMTFKTYTGPADFAACYPFAAYQFTLVQKVFESIRKAGATGLHLSQGERSTLDAFQGAAIAIGPAEIGALVPFHRFYPAVEGFLDTAVKRTIDHAAESHVLEPFDATILQLLFLIRYVDELPGSVDNLVTLCVDQIDADRLALRRQIEASLNRLEKETLVGRNGDLYFFLTNEERDIGREIKNVSVPSGSEERLLGQLIFDDILGGMNKHTYSVTGRNFSFTRICDDYPVGHRIEGSLEVAVVSPLGDAYGLYTADAKCVLDTSDNSNILIRLPDGKTLGRELRTYLQTENYVRTRSTSDAPDSTKRILRDRSAENRSRRARIVAQLRTMLADAAYFTCGKRLDLSRSEPQAALAAALEYLIQNAFPKMDYIHHLSANPKQEIQSTLRANNIEQVQMTLDTPESNQQALADLRDYIRLSAQASRQIVLYDLINNRYGNRPYGWPELEVVLLVARLAVLKEIDLLVNAAPLPLDSAYDHLTSSSRQRQVIIAQRRTAGTDLIKQARDLGRELFATAAPDSEEALFTTLRDHLAAWDGELHGYQPLAETGSYPGLAEIKAGRAALRKFIGETDSVRFLERVVANRAELLDLADDMRDLHDFYTTQKHSWEELRRAVTDLAPNRLQLETHPAAGPAFKRMEAILAAPHPYAMLPEAGGLIHTARAVNTQLVTNARVPAVAAIQTLLDSVRGELDAISADPALRATATARLQRLLDSAATAASIPHIAQARHAAETAYDDALIAIEEAQPSTQTASDDPTPRPAPALKKRRVVEARAHSPGSGFIETEAELQAFLSSLRAAIAAALANNEKVQIK